MTERSERLKEARKAAGFASAADAARHFGWPAPTYCAHENATRNFPYERAKTYAQAYGVGLQWLYDGDVDARHDFVPIVGTIGAGECVTPIDDHERGAAMEYAPMPPDMNEPNLVAVRIKGDSMRPLRDGWLVYYQRDQDGVPDSCLNQLCVAKLETGEVYIKELRNGREPGLYSLFSWTAGFDPMEDVRLEWAAKVRAIRANDD